MRFLSFIFGNSKRFVISFFNGFKQQPSLHKLQYQKSTTYQNIQSPSYHIPLRIPGLQLNSSTFKED